ncbi:MAG TPA: hypothetical protein VER96_24545 [Polyangiaceae bacterium]|nr:hypothetical protein [Polyangiaceae bacterium]
MAVVHTPEQAEQARRLSAEVLAAGLAPVDATISRSDQRSISQITLAFHARSGLRLKLQGELEWLVVAAESGSFVQGKVLRGQRSETELEVIAVEELRAQLVELSMLLPTPVAAPASVADPSELLEDTGASEQAPKKDADSATQSSPGAIEPSEPQASAPAAPARTDHDQDIANTTASAPSGGVWLGAALGGTLGSGGLSPSAIASFRLRVQAWSRGSISCVVFLPLSSQNVSGERGTATVEAYLLGATAGVVALRFQRLDWDLALGGAAMHATMAGVAAMPSDVARSQTVWAAVAFVDASLAWRASSWLSLRVNGVVGLSAPRPTVRFDHDVIASWGRPLALATLGFEIEPFRAGRKP